MQILVFNKDIIHNLKSIVGSENVLTDSSELVAYSYDSQAVNAIPDAMVLDSATDEIAAVVRLAAAGGMPLLPGEPEAASNCPPLFCRAREGLGGEFGEY